MQSASSKVLLGVHIFLTASHVNNLQCVLSTGVSCHVYYANIEEEVCETKDIVCLRMGKRKRASV